jgi:hypothetical protein
MKFRYQAVERIPSPMEPGVVYHSKEFELAGLLCACGCSHKITLLVPDGHQVYEQAGGATIHPSVGVLDAPCKSHFIVTVGEVDWLPPFTSTQAARIIHSQIARHVARDAKPKPKARIERLRAVIAVIAGALAALKRVFFR